MFRCFIALAFIMSMFLATMTEAAAPAVQPATQPTTRPDFKVWKTIRIGNLKTADEVRASLKVKGCVVTDYTLEIINNPALFSLSPQEGEVDLVVVTPADLGLGEVRLPEVYAKAFSLGLSLCPAEVGPQLRLQYTDQPKGESLVIGMEPIVPNPQDMLGSIDVFGVGAGTSSGRKWINRTCGNPTLYWPVGTKFVFVRRMDLVAASGK